jgi:methylated-DNA-[protein]-cysteine S-methyltransferase
MAATAAHLARKSSPTLSYTTIDSPVGPLLLAGTDHALHFLSFAASRRAVRPKPAWKQAAAPFKEVQRQLKAYFARELKKFALPLALEGSEFQLDVWKNLQLIPFGETVSYGELARRIGNPDAARAVGLANGQNPIAIIIPCHRVIGSDGSLTGFGGGLPIKEKLLRHEASQVSLF